MYMPISVTAITFELVIYLSSALILVFFYSENNWSLYPVVLPAFRPLKKNRVQVSLIL